jgi:hypothetical protein
MNIVYAAYINCILQASYPCEKVHLSSVIMVPSLIYNCLNFHAVLIRRTMGQILGILKSGALERKVPSYALTLRGFKFSLFSVVCSWTWEEINQSLAAPFYFDTFWIGSQGVNIYIPFMLCLVSCITHKEHFRTSWRPCHVKVHLIEYLNLLTWRTSERERMYIIR